MDDDINIKQNIVLQYIQQNIVCFGALVILSLTAVVDKTNDDDDSGDDYDDDDNDDDDDDCRWW